MKQLTTYLIESKESTYNIYEDFKISHDIPLPSEFDVLSKKYGFNGKIDFVHAGGYNFETYSAFRVDLVKILRISPNKRVTKRNVGDYINIDADGYQFYYCKHNGDTVNYTFNVDGTNTFGEIVLDVAQTYLDNYDDFEKAKPKADMPDKKYLQNLINYIKNH